LRDRCSVRTTPVGGARPAVLHFSASPHPGLRRDGGPPPGRSPSMAQPQVMEKLVSLCKRRGFVFQSSEIYGGLGSVWDYGPLGAAPKHNGKARGREAVVRARA